MANPLSSRPPAEPPIDAGAAAQAETGAVAETRPGAVAETRPGAVVAVRTAGRGGGQGAVLAAIAAGGALGALGRSALATAWPAPAPGLPWATLVTNVSGCLFIGVLMVLVTEVWAGRRLLRPFLGVGVLGGYTTFSTYAVDVTRLLAAHAAGTALAYLVATPVAALLAVYAGTAITRWLVRPRGQGEQ